MLLDIQSPDCLNSWKKKKEKEEKCPQRNLRQYSNISSSFKQIENLLDLNMILFLWSLSFS